jgi:hypothetical protein
MSARNPRKVWVAEQKEYSIMAGRSFQTNCETQLLVDDREYGLRQWDVYATVQPLTKEIKSVGLDGATRCGLLETGWNIEINLCRSDSRLSDYMSISQPTALDDLANISILHGGSGLEGSLMRYRFTGAGRLEKKLSRRTCVIFFNTRGPIIS